MRIVGLVFSLLVTLSVATIALTYIPGYIGQQRIYVRGHNNHHYLGNVKPDTVRTAAGDPDPYRQRYYSQSEGWTYFTLPSYSSGP